MQNTHDNYEEINIFGILWHCLSHWKSILIVGLIGLVLGCGIVVFNASSIGASSGEQSGEESTKQVIAEKVDLFAEERANGIQEYVEASRILELNPYDLYKGAVTYRVDASQGSLEAINGAVFSYVFNGSLFEELEEKTGQYNAKDLAQLIGYAYYAPKTVVTTSEAVMGQMTITITVLGDTDDEAQELVTNIVALVSGYLSDISEEYLISEYAVQETTVAVAQSTTLSDYQDKIRTKLSSESDVAASVDSSVAENKTGSDTSINVDKEELIIYAGIGFIGGCIIAAIIWIVVFVLGGRLYAVSNLKEKFALKQLGTINDFQKLKALDRWIAQKRAGIYSSFALDEQRRILLMNVKNELNKTAEIKKVFLCSSLGEHLVEAEVLKNSLIAEGYEVEGCANVIGRSDMLEKAATCDAAIILEDKNLSKTVLVDEEISILKDYVSNILGMIITEAKNK